MIEFGEDAGERFRDALKRDGTIEVIISPTAAKAAALIQDHNYEAFAVSIMKGSGWTNIMLVRKEILPPTKTPFIGSSNG